MVCLFWASSLLAEEVRLRTTYPSREGRFKNLNVKELVLSPQTPTVDPSAPPETQPTTLGGPLQEGQVYYDTLYGCLRYYDGSKWADLTQEEARVTLTLGTITKLLNQETTFVTSGTRKIGGFSDWTISGVPSGDACGSLPTEPCTRIVDTTSPVSKALQIKMHQKGDYAVTWGGDLLVNADSNLYVKVILETRTMGFDSNQVWGPTSGWKSWDPLTADQYNNFGGTAQTWSIPLRSVPKNGLAWSPARQFRVKIVVSKRRPEINTDADMTRVKVVMRGGFSISFERD